MELTIKLDRRNKQAKALIDFLKSLSFVEVKEEKEEKNSPYNPEFVEMIKVAEKEIEKGNTIRVNPNNVWESIM